MAIPMTRAELNENHDEIIRQVRQIYMACLQTTLTPVGGLNFVILYGSRARGDYSWNSDVDLVICSPAFDGVRVLDRFDIIAECSLAGISAEIEPVCYSAAEALSALDAGRVTILEALQDGIDLFDDGSILPELHAKFDALKASGRIARRKILGNLVWDIRGLLNL